MKEKRPRIRKSRKEPTRERKLRNPPQITGFWGRGASPYRPGIFTKAYFLEHTEACCADIFHALRQNLEGINQERIEIGEKPIRGGTYNSYAKLWNLFRLLGLIERTDKREAAVYDFLEERVFYRLTSKGEAEEAPWQDPARARHPEFG